MKTFKNSILLAFALVFSLLSTQAQVRTFQRGTTASVKGNTVQQAMKTASVVLVSFDNASSPIADGFTDLVQNAGNNYAKCFQGYDRSILLKKRWNGTNQPTMHITTDLKNEFFNQIKSLEQQGYLIDIFIFAHGYSNGTISTDFGNISRQDITSRLGNKCYPIRLVYQMNCYGSKIASAFTSVGAKTVAGADLINFYPNQFNKFIDNWNSNQTVSRALTNSNTASSRTAGQTYIVAHSNTKFNFRKCIPGSTVLGKRPCAEDYFDKNWGLDGTDYDANLSGKDNMNSSSRMIVLGTGNLRKSQKSHSCLGGGSSSTSGNNTPANTFNPSTILNVSGNVLSARRAKKVTLQKSRTNQATVRIDKTDGKARTTVTVYILENNGSETYKDSYEFVNGKYTRSRTLTINGVQDKKLVVYLRNHSVSNQFKYRLTVKEKQ
jgi:hypothetical protein